MTRQAMSILLAALAASCALDEDPELGTARYPLNAREAFRRVVAARMFQHDLWMLPAADGYRAAELPDPTDRRIAYVCDKLA
ncbi:MAG TPA: hypothetical protein VFU21_29360, partial [Kofleriaceae bacterium]|nr:hypothetical protein [Kofleriaceae bacterium]